MSGDIFDIEQGDRETITGTLHDPGATTGDVLTVQADKSIAAAPGGGSTPFQRITVPFSFDTPNLDTGIIVWTPAVGDLLLDAIFWPGTAQFDADPSAADIGRIAGGAWVDVNAGYFAYGNSLGPMELSILPTGPGVSAAYNWFGGMIEPISALSDPAPSLVTLSMWPNQNAQPGSPPANDARMTPKRMLTTDPIYLVVSADGTPSGGPCGALAGDAILDLLVCTSAT